ncbi:unnamed protein product [Brachionus calyciflorus]|uniref:Fucosyltransferase n=1 Tax=Brachionus calyciflorus TaxID=104777 RepID=A0A813MWQ2_9BILA|nr:unnamed protein product [Brachionus calyciflorus]
MRTFRFRNLKLKLVISISLFFITIFFKFSPNDEQSHFSKQIIKTSFINNDILNNHQKASNEYKTIYQLPRWLKDKNEKYVILEYTNVFFRPKFCGKKREDIFDSNVEKCEYKNCEYTCDKINYLSKADALIFHLRDLEIEFKKNFTNFEIWLNSTNQIPFKTTFDKLKNNHEQIWILWNDEARKIDRRFNWISQLFNWTLTYKTDAEIFEGQNAILWFVSNCKSKLRLKIALELSKFYPVHIYGRCNLSNNLTQEEFEKIYPFIKIFNYEKESVYCGKKSKCEKEKFQTYKYYIAFENNNCSSYISEKLWKSLKEQMIPIVLQPTRQSYENYQIPAKSFIHLEDYAFDVEKLGNHLRQIDNNFDIYYEHLKWTLNYNTYIEAKQAEPHRMCQMCKQLNTYKDRISYNKIVGFFNDNCKT